MRGTESGLRLTEVRSMFCHVPRLYARNFVHRHRYLCEQTHKGYDNTWQLYEIPKIFNHISFLHTILFTIPT